MDQCSHFKRLTYCWYGMQRDMFIRLILFSCELSSVIGFDGFFFFNRPIKIMRNFSYMFLIPRCLVTMPCTILKIPVLSLAGTTIWKTTPPIESRILLLLHYQDCAKHRGGKGRQGKYNIKSTFLSAFSLLTFFS